MSAPARLVLLNGSPKGKGGTSGQLGNFVLDQVPDDRTTKATHHLGKAIRKDDRWAQVMADVDAADTVILTFPLYWDALPSHLTLALERIAAHRREAPPAKPQRLVVIVNNGFPEPWHNEVSLRICRRFADEAGFDWGGGMNIGGGAAIGGRSLEEAGGVTIKVRKVLEKAASHISAGEPLSPEVEQDAYIQMYPAWFNTVFGGMGWRQQARKQGAKVGLKDRPYD